MKTRKIAAFLTALAMTAATACSDAAPENEGKNQAEPAAADTAAVTEASKPDEAVTTTPENKPEEKTETEPELLINRKRRDTETPMGEEGTWTVLVYLCGSDLETNSGAGSSDIYEMIDSSVNENVRYVVQTGGSKQWQIDVSTDACERYLVQDGSCDLVYSGDEVNMGESSSLADFVQWGVSEYPAANMGLVLWDHGGGSIDGVCLDEKHDYKSLALKDIDAALYSVFDQMTEPFEFIGFDACLMGTAETAAIMATHANYLIASQEIEPGSGWDYTAIGNYMAENPSCTGAELGKVIVDSFYDSCAQGGEENGATLSVTDLRKIDTFIERFNDYSKDIYEIVENGGDFTSVARNINKADNYGGNDKASGYTNMIDIDGLISAGFGSSANAEAALKALNDAVVYRKNGSDHPAACGLSVYYPLQVKGSAELSIFKDIALSPYYLGLVTKVAYGQVNGSTEGFNSENAFEVFSNNWSEDQYTETDGFLSYTGEHIDEWNFADDLSLGNGKADIKFDEEPYIDEENNYAFTISEETIDNVDHIEGSVLIYDEEDQFAVDLGNSGEVYGDVETRTISGGYNRKWFTLPDGQAIAAYIYDTCDGYDLYSSPILLNGKETNLRFAYFYEEDTVEIIDAWDGIDENGFAARSGRKLEAGDIITPRYYLIMLDSESEVEDQFFNGDEYKFTKKTKLSYSDIGDGDFLYCFYIYDIYGNYEMTDLVLYSVKGEEIECAKIE